jgi:hypothetical protein
MQVETIGTDKDNGYNASQHLIVKVKAPKISGTMKVHPMSTTDRLRCEGTLTIGGYDKTIFAGHAVKKNGQWVGELTAWENMTDSERQDYARVVMEANEQTATPLVYMKQEEEYRAGLR